MDPRIVIAFQVAKKVAMVSFLAAPRIMFSPLIAFWHQIMVNAETPEQQGKNVASSNNVKPH